MPACIFDLDGVLVDTEPLYTEATQRIVGRWGHVFEWGLKSRMMGRGALESATILVEALALPLSPEDYLGQRAGILRELFATAAAMPGAEALVARSRERGHPLAVATSSHRDLFEVKTAHHPWIPAMGPVVCGDEVRRPKPAPDIFLAAAAHLGAEPGECWVYEDSPAGVQAARAAGMRVIARVDPHLDLTLFEGAHRVVRAWDEVDLDALRP